LSQPTLAINFDQRDIVTDPSATYDEIRAAGRVVKNSLLGVSMIAGYNDTLTVLHDTKRFSSKAYTAGNDLDVLGGAEIMINTDPPEQIKLRKVVQNAFLRSSLSKLENTITRVVDDLLSAPSFQDAVASGGEIEIVEAFCRPVPAQVIALLMGVPLTDLEKFIKWSEDLSAVMDSGQRGGDEWDTTVKHALAAGDAMRAYLQEQIELHRRTEHDDLINDLLIANENGILDDKDVVASCILLLIAGNETTTKLIGTTLRLLGQYSDDRKALAEDLRLLPNAIEEVLRSEGVTTIVPRLVTEDTTVGDIDLPAGEFLLLLLGGANRDPEAFPDPARFDIRRTPNHHLAFGHGVHHCLGNRLARMEAEIAVSGILRRYPDYQVGDWAYRPVFLTRGLEHMRFTMA
jgi:cytochrome P450